MKYGYIELRLIIDWARKVPGFSSLRIPDQMAMLKSSFMELNILRLAYRSLGHEGMFKFAQDIVMSPERCLEIGWGQDLCEYTLEFIGRLRGFKIDVTEFCLLNAVVLTYPDAPGVENKIEAINLQSRILECLQRYSSKSYPDDPKRYVKMLLWLPSLRTVSSLAADRFLNLSVEGNITMNALVLEMMS